MLKLPIRGLELGENHVLQIGLIQPLLVAASGFTAPTWKALRIQQAWSRDHTSAYLCVFVGQDYDKPKMAQKGPPSLASTTMPAILL